VFVKNFSMMAKDNFYFPLFYKRLLSSTIGWKDDELGAYIRLLIYQFDNNNQIPKDLKELSRVAPSVKKNWKLLSKKFKENSTGNLFNEVMSDIYEKVHNKKLTNHENGIKGGRPKKSERLLLQNPEETERFYENNPNETQDITETKPIPIIKRKKKASKEEVFELMRTQTDRSLFSDQFLRKEVDAFLGKFHEDRIGNLASLVSGWMQNLKPDILPKEMVI
jgi:uncharacterized protein YdaU (DUF1376 family)